MEQAARSAGEAHEALGARMQEACDTAYAAVSRHVAARDRRIDTTHAELARLRRDVEAAADATRDATVDAFRAMEDAVAAFATTGRLSFAAFFDTVIAEMARFAVHRTVTRPLSDLLFGALSGVSGAGGGTPQPALFDGAPRFHSGGVAGLRPDEVPAILQRGEGVFTPAQMRALGTPDVTVQIENRGTPQRVMSHAVHFDPRALVVSIVIDDLAQNGPIRQMFVRDVLGGPI